MFEVAPLIEGGTWTACYHLVRNLVKQGVHIRIVVPWSERDIDEKPFGVPIELLCLGIDVEQFTSSYSNSHQSSAEIQEKNHFSKLDPAILAGEFRRRVVQQIVPKANEVIHAHDWICFNAAKSLSNKWGNAWLAHFHSTVSEREPYGGNQEIYEIEARGAKMCQAVITPSNITANHIIDDYKIAYEKICIIPNSFEREPSTEGQDKSGCFECYQVIFLGRLTSQKGPDIFCDIAASVQQELPKAKFCIFGSGPDLKQVISCQAEISYAGQLKWLDRAQAFSGTSVLCVPSRAEPFGMVILEAMSYGVPVVYPADSGAAEVMNSGVKVEVKDVKAVAKQIKLLLSDRSCWDNVVSSQNRDLARYCKLNHAHALFDIWTKLFTLDT